MTDEDSDNRLEQGDGDFHSPLERVHYAPGMLLGVEATRDEQRYHRQRLNRHQYWLHGAGTVVGLGVTLDFEETEDTETDMSLRLVVSPGVAIDRLGREVTAGEPHCVNLRDWFESQLDSPQGQSLVRDGLEADGETLSLLITLRYRSCEAGLQPVMARKVNAGTDPVDTSRARDSLLLEIVPGPLPEKDEDWFWPGHDPADSPEDVLTETETAYLETLGGAEKHLKSLQARLVHALPNHNRALELRDDPEVLARTLLAQVRVPLRPEALPSLSPVVNHHRISVNNLVRPFAATAEQLVWLTRQE